MTLYEMSFVYEESWELLRKRVQELHRAEKETKDSEELRRIRQRLSELDPMLREMRELTMHTRHYYEKGYHKNEKYSL